MLFLITFVEVMFPKLAKTAEIFALALYIFWNSINEAGEGLGDLCVLVHP